MAIGDGLRFKSKLANQQKGKRQRRSSDLRASDKVPNLVDKVIAE
jgi:hypothetical protein